jgi:hypothetical protein
MLIDRREKRKCKVSNRKGVWEKFMEDQFDRKTYHISL